ncbi:MAG TPA: hypothetical protein PK734_02170 [Bacteroidales bacterium]|nr:MAG: hypothetical protein BWY22_01150 [Bacteroidetes bacterium ADurb.Bin217]HPM12277.1 hypothetical protein [Bacteroidales bacterium]
MGTNLELLGNTLQEKIRIVTSMHTVIKQQNNELRTKNNELQQIIEQQNNTIKELERNYKNLQIAKAVSDSGGDTTEAKRKIEEIVREIDTCIALLNK